MAIDKAAEEQASASHDAPARPKKKIVIVGLGMVAVAFM
jgi:hypothetical protein